MAVGDIEGKIEVFETKSWKTLARVKGGERAVNCLQFTPDGRTLLSGSGDGLVTLWEVTTGKQRGVLRLNYDGVFYLSAFSGNELFVAQVRGPALELWNLRSAQRLPIPKELPEKSAP